MSALIFIDTNILLDFYRQHGHKGALSILNKLDDHHDKIITTDQVEMEYKKNRQKVILDSYQSINMPNIQKPNNIPLFLLDSQEMKSIASLSSQLRTRFDRLKKRTLKLIQNPSRTDPVYKTLQKMFKANCQHHLTRKKKIRYQIRRLAKKRFMLGYPPRKDEQLTLGDAINWEWIIQCAQTSTDEIIIVSRDSDYGLHDKQSNASTLNDWLLQEFKQRISRKRKITLTRFLTKAFEQASIRVSSEEIEAEESFLDITRQPHHLPPELLVSSMRGIKKALEDFIGPDKQVGDMTIDFPPSSTSSGRKISINITNPSS